MHTLDVTVGLNTASVKHCRLDQRLPLTERNMGVPSIWQPSLIVGNPNQNTRSMMLHYVIVKTVVLVGLIGMHKTGCSGETRLVLHVPSSS